MVIQYTIRYSVLTIACNYNICIFRDSDTSYRLQLLIVNDGVSGEGIAIGYSSVSVRPYTASARLIVSTLFFD